MTLKMIFEANTVVVGVCFDETQMKKETKKLVGFEEALLNNYRHYLESLESFATGCKF